MSSDVVNPDELEVAPGFVHEQLQGWVPPLEIEEEIRAALEKAFDYRGDVKITCKDGRVLDGYLYDRRSAKKLPDSFVRLLPADGSPRTNVSYADIAAIRFSDRDPAAGKTWEAWVRKYWEKKAAGRAAEITPESLE